MRILFVSAVFPPEVAPAATMAAQLAGWWSSRGHEVTVACPTPNRPAGRIHDGYVRRLFSRSEEHGANIVRVWTWIIGQRRSVIDRVLENVTLGVGASLVLLSSRRPDVAVVEAWPVLGYVPIVLAAKWRRVPIVNYVQDVYPEAAEAAGVLKVDSLAARSLRALDRWICHASTRTVAISDSMRRLIAETRRLPDDRLFTIHNWLDLSSVEPQRGSSRWRAEQGFGSEFVCMYSGTLGLASGAEILVDTAERLRDQGDIRIVCIGDGVLKERMASVIRARSLTNITLLPFQPPERVAEVQSSADLMLLTASPAMGASSIPSKLITYLAVGKPVLCSIDLESEIAQLIRGGRLGLAVQPGSAEALARGIMQARAMDPSTRTQMGERARAAALEHYSLEAALRRFDLLFADMGLPGSPTSALPVGDASPRASSCTCNT